MVPASIVAVGTRGAVVPTSGAVAAGAGQAPQAGAVVLQGVRQLSHHEQHPGTTHATNNASRSFLAVLMAHLLPTYAFDLPGGKMANRVFRT